jgi:hypothetical protein
VLASLLPGFRDVRAPLAAGYVWLLALYLAVEPSLPSREHARGVWASLVTLKDELTALGAGVALSFIAYLVGSISEALVGSAARIPQWWRRALAHPRTPRAMRDPGRAISKRLRLSTSPPSTHRARRVPYGDKGAEALAEVVNRRLVLLDGALMRRGVMLNTAGIPYTPWYRNHPMGLIQNFVSEAMSPSTAPSREPVLGSRSVRSEARELLRKPFCDAVAAELGLTPTRLLGNEPELFSIVDRLRAEAEFRFALAPPLLGLAFVLGWRATWWSAVIAATSALILVLQGRARMRQFNDALLEALRVDRTRSPTLDRLDAAIERLTSPKESQQHEPASQESDPTARVAPPTSSGEEPTSPAR